SQCSQHPAGCGRRPPPLLSIQQEPSEAPTPKRPRGRPKGSKNKATPKGRVGTKRGQGMARGWGWHGDGVGMGQTPDPCVAFLQCERAANSYFVFFLLFFPSPPSPHPAATHAHRPGSWEQFSCPSPPRDAALPTSCGVLPLFPLNFSWGRCSGRGAERDGLQKPKPGEIRAGGRGGHCLQNLAASPAVLHPPASQHQDFRGGDGTRLQ
uniref:Uncharacterized protein n=1 Tax=Cairina moschata TaxID=8855 RepID=A0A8C3GK43_CAIMO